MIRHNDIRDFEAGLLSKVCSDVETKPALQPVTNETLQTGNIIGDEARLDIRARGLWRRGQNAFFDVRVTNANATISSNAVFAVGPRKTRAREETAIQSARDEY